MQVIETILPPEYYCEVAGMMRDSTLALDLLKVEEKEIMDHINKIGGMQAELMLTNLISKWFLSLFVQGTNTEIFYAIWDAMLMEGCIVLFRATVGIISLLKDKFLLITSLEELNELLEEGVQDFNDREELLKLLFKHHITFQMEGLMQERDKSYYTKAFDLIKSSKNKGKNVTPAANPNECDKDWPFCVKETNFCLTQQYFTVFKMLEPIKVEENFYGEATIEKVNAYKEKVKKSEEEKQRKCYKELLTEKERLVEKIKSFSELLIVRRNHTCGSIKQTHVEIQMNEQKGNNSSGSFGSYNDLNKAITMSFMERAKCHEQNIATIFNENAKSPNMNKEIQIDNTIKESEDK